MNVEISPKQPSNPKINEIDPRNELFSYFKNEEKLYQALIEIKRPTLLLKYGKNGTPHFRNFYVSQSYDKLMWISPKKLNSELLMKDIVKIIKGKQTEKFKKHKVDEYENLSFSIIYLSNSASSKKNKFETDSLDITCKDTKEYDIWYNTIKACFFACKCNFDLLTIENNMFDKKDEEYIDIDELKFKTAKDLQKDSTDLKSLFFWGSNNYLQCGVSSIHDKILEPSELIQINKNEDPILLALGYSHSLILQSNGDVLSFGCALNNRLGLEDCEINTSTNTSFLPTKISIFSLKIKSISCGDFHSAVLDDFGSIFTWGSNYYGQLGVNFFQDKFYPEKVLITYENELKSAKIISIKCGPTYTVIITKENLVYVTGNNKYNVLGLDINKSNYTQFEKINGLTNIAGVGCGGYHMLAYDKEKKNVYSWGWNEMSQLGIGDKEQSKTGINTIFTLKNPDSEIVQVEAGMVHSSFLMKDKSISYVYTWGGNSFGQLGNGLTENINIPKQVDILTEENIVQISCGMFHMGAITSNGQVLMWGDGSNGILGNGTTSGSKIPLMCKNEEFLIHNAFFLACGGSHTGVITKKSLEARKLANECKICKVRLDTIFKRKNYCRNCSDLFCYNCSSKKIAIIKLGYIEPVKVCDVCYDNLKI